MNRAQAKRGGAPVGFMAELDEVGATSVIYLRLWCDGPDGQASISDDLAMALGLDQGERAFQSFANLCKLCAQHGRRPLMRHAINCKCLGADEACFAHFVEAAAQGEQEDAMLIATLMVRANIAPMVASLAAEVGNAFCNMRLRMPQSPDSRAPAFYPGPTTLH